MARQTVVLGAGVLAVGLGLAFYVSSRQSGATAAGDRGAVDTGVPQGHVYTGIAEEPPHVNPFTVESGVARRYILGFTHDTLLDTDPVTGALRPALATAWTVDSDGLGFTCDLREGVRFSDGQIMTPRDVLFTWEVARAGHGILGAMGDGMRLVRDARLLLGTPVRLRVELGQVHFAAVRAVTESWLVVQRAFFEEQIDLMARQEGVDRPTSLDPGYSDLLAKIRDSGPGTGPYQIGRSADGNPSWRKKRDLLLVRNPHCWRRTAQPGTWNLDGVRLLFLGNEAAVYSELLKRNLDWYMTPDPETVLAQEPSLKEDYRKLAYDNLFLGTYVVHWNHRRKGLDDSRVRRALGMLFDRRAMVDTLMGGAGVPAVSYFKPGTRFYPTDLQPLAFDPTGARRLLRDAGYDPEDGRPLRVSILFPAGAELFRQVMDLAIAAANRAGVDLQVHQVDWPTLTQREKEGTWDGICWMERHATWVDPHAVFHSGSNLNRMGLADAEVDELLDAIRIELDEDRRVALCQRLNRRLHFLQPLTFLAHPRVNVLFNAHIQDAEPGVLGLYPERFWVPVEFQRN